MYGEVMFDVFPTEFSKVKDHWRLDKGEMSHEDYAYPDESKAIDASTDTGDQLHF